MVKRYFYLIVLIGLVLLLGVCEKRTPVARVGNYFIYSDELADQMKNSRVLAETHQDILNHVNTLIDEKLKLCDAVQAGFDNDTVVIARIKDFESRKLYSLIVEKEVINKIVTNSKIRKRYRLLSREWHARHILLPASQDSLATIESLKSLRSRILRGEDFGQLARSYSKDAKTAGKNGDLGFIQYDLKKWDERLLNTLLSLSVGQVSNVIRTNLGFHLVKLEQVRNVDQKSFRDEKENIKTIIIRENITALDSAFYKFRDDISERYNAKQIPENIDSLLTLIKKVEAEHTDEKVNLQRDPQQFAGVLTEEERNFPLATYRGGTYVFKDILDTYLQISPMRRPLFNSTAAIEEFLNRNVPRVLMIRLAYEKGLDRNPEIKKEVQQEKERQMISRINRVKIDRNTDLTNDELLQFYNDEPHLYERDVRVNVQEIVISDLTKAKEIYQKAITGNDFDELVREYNEREDTKKQNGVLGFLGLRDYGMVSRYAVKMKVGEISEPIKSNNRYSIIKILDRQSSGLKPFDEVRLQIRREKKIERRDQLTKEWLAALRKSYSVVIYDDVIKKEFDIADE